MCKFTRTSRLWISWRTQLFVKVFSFLLEEKDPPRRPSVFRWQGCVCTQSQTRRAWLTTEVGREASFIPHISVVLLPSGKLQDQIEKSVPSLGGQVWCDPGMIYKALGGVHMICAPLAKFSFGDSDSFEGKCIRWGQMGSLTGTRGASSKPYETQKQLIFPPLIQKSKKHATHVVSRRSWMYKHFPGFAKNKNKLLLISEGRKAGLILQALL